jgi:2-hydroxy-3-oxopropionate reductase
MSASPLRIGFIGLGIMGRPMARNLLAKTGCTLTVCNRSPAAANELAGLGATIAATPAAVAAVSDVVFTMLPDSPDVKAVVLGPDGVLAGAHPGLVLVDTSSIAPLVAKEVAARAAAVGVAMLDAPVSGGEPKAVAGTLAFMVGGDAAVFARVQPLLATMGSSVTHVGEIGSGNLTKLANQIIVALNIAAVSEALVLAAKSGVDPQVVVQAIRSGLAGSTVLEAKAPMMLAGNFAPGFRIGLHIKDLQNALDTASAAGAALPLTGQVMEMLTTLRAEGHGGEDHSGLVQRYEALAGVRLSNRG